MEVGGGQAAGEQQRIRTPHGDVGNSQKIISTVLKHVKTWQKPDYMVQMSVFVSNGKGLD